MAGKSCEPQRTAAYDEDLLRRAVYQRYALEFSSRKIAWNLNIDIATVHRIIDQFDTTNSVKRASYPRGESHFLRKLTNVDALVLIEAIITQPGIYLHELQQHLLKETGTQISVPTICNFLHKNGFTRQKLARVAIQQSSALRSTFLGEISLFAPKMFIFIDETGSDRRDCLRR